MRLRLRCASGCKSQSQKIWGSHSCPNCDTSTRRCVMSPGTILPDATLMQPCLHEAANPAAAHPHCLVVIVVRTPSATLCRLSCRQFFSPFFCRAPNRLAERATCTRHKDNNDLFVKRASTKCEKKVKLVLPANKFSAGEVLTTGTQCGLGVCRSTHRANPFPSRLPIAAD